MNGFFPYIGIHKKKKQIEDSFRKNAHKHFFAPSYNITPRAIPFWVTQSPTDWDDI
jgi:hypothetical protein